MNILAPAFNHAQSSAQIFILGGLLVCLSIIDIRQRRLPNDLVLAIAMLGISLALATSIAEASLTPLKAALLGALFSSVPALIFSFAYLTFRGKEGFGAGDIKLLAALGLVVGPAGILILPIASTLAAMVKLPQLFFTKEKVREQSLAFGPYISLATLTLIAFCYLY